MRLYWTDTGDCVDVDVDNSTLAQYWIEQLNCTQKNNFDFVDSSFPSQHKHTQLSQYVASVNQVLTKFKIDSLGNQDHDWFNQENLNRLHEQWVKVQHKYKITDLLTRLSDKHTINHFHAINHLIHELEDNVVVRYDNGQTWQVENIFGPEITKFGRWQIEIHYQNLGRSNFEKWHNFDQNANDSDTNNFTHIGGVIDFNLGRAYQSCAPNEYMNYCNLNQISAYGNVLPLGNFKLDITQLRHIFYKNVSIKNNRISFEI